MRVRVFDRVSNKYFISEVYALINTGYYEKYLVVQEIEGNRYFKLFNNLYKNDKTGDIICDVNIICKNDDSTSWVIRTESDLEKISKKLKTKKRKDIFLHYYGYDFILEDETNLLNLLKDEKVSYEKIMQDHETICTKLSGWNYIDNELDVKYLMKTFSGFHDSVLKCLNYVSGSRLTKTGGMNVIDDIRQVSMIFDHYDNSIEVVFEGTLMLNLRPTDDNYTSEIFGATILLKDKFILFYDNDYIDDENNYQGTFIKALCMRWRFI